VPVTFINREQRKIYNKIVDHPLQSYEWGEFREKTGIKVIRRGLFENGALTDAFTLTLHSIPKTSFTIGYMPKTRLPQKWIIEELKKIGKEYKCIFIQCEPNIQNSDETKGKLLSLSFKPSTHPLFTRFTFILDLKPTEDELLKNLHPKTRYNIRVAQRHGVTIAEKNTEDAFTVYQELTEQTTKRQKFFAHTPSYHQIQWKTLLHEAKSPYNALSSHLFTATYNKKVLAAWILFVFKDTLYYPYGASSNEHREVMASNLIMWEAIKYGKKLGLKKFDMWGALGPDPDVSDTWYGFHKFKQGYRPDHIEFVGSYDYVLNPILYRTYSTLDKLRWLLLRIKN